ncbi:MAG: 2,3-bisphosphoglycerate-independent phosphoglycerate mutase [Candidatus Altiarchaeota archaeon]|nr:2,3-bisphosphoglycerate-independent phosphoglycerate mutase [Candidatus Altiarchaeota archaeon]
MKLLPGPQLIMVLIDGLGDRPIKALENRTPLEAARTPTMDKMAREGTQGVYYPLGPGVPVGSGVAHNLLFEYDIEEYEGRGVLEVLGMGVELKKGDLCFRVNFATFNNRDVVLDRRAGRADKDLDEITLELNKAFNPNPFKKEIKLIHGFGHRGALIIRGWGGEVDLPEIDPQIEGMAIELPEGTREAELASFIFKTARKVMSDSVYNIKREKAALKPANGLLLRGASIYKPLESLEARTGLKSLAIAREHLYLGAARFAGMTTIQVDKDKDKVDKLMKNVHNYDFFFLHFKKTDTAGHDGKYMDKKKAIEEIDALIKPLLTLDNVAIVITGDHSTPCELKTHSGDAVPALFWGLNVPADEQVKFGERFARRGGAGQMHGGDVLRMLMNYAGRMVEYGL